MRSKGLVETMGTHKYLQQWRHSKFSSQTSWQTKKLHRGIGMPRCLILGKGHSRRNDKSSHKSNVIPSPPYKEWKYNWVQVGISSQIQCGLVHRMVQGQTSSKRIQSMARFQIPRNLHPNQLHVNSQDHPCTSGHRTPTLTVNWHLVSWSIPNAKSHLVAHI